MINGINEKKLPIKYFLRVYNLQENYPQVDDILYEIASNVDSLNGIPFCNKDINDMLITKTKITNIDKALNKLEKQNYIELVEINKNIKYFKLLKHDWI